MVAPADGASDTVALITESSPAANPLATSGPLGVPAGVGLGEGVGLPVGVGDAGATGTKLAPVNKEIVPVDSVVFGGDRL